MDQQENRSHGSVSGQPANARYIAKVDADKLTDEITNLIDDAICNGKFATYDEWQGAISDLLKEHGAA